MYLTDDEADALRRAAIRDGRSQAELIREGVRRVIAEAGANRREFRSLGKGRGRGAAYEPWGVDELYDKAMGKR